MRKSIKKASPLTLASVVTLSLAAYGSNNTPTDSATAAPAADTTTAVGGDTTTVAASTEPVELKFSWWGGDTKHEATKKVIEAFMTKHPNIAVTPEYGAWTGWEEKQPLDILGGNAADVIQINWDQIESYSDNGTNFTNPEGYADVFDLIQFPQESLGQCKVDGKPVAVPVALAGRLFYWNKTTFDEVGVTLPTDEASLLTAGAAFKAYNEDYHPLALGEYDRAVFLVYYLESVYGKPWIVDGQMQYTEGEIAAGMDYISKLEDEYAIPTLVTIDGDTADSLDKNAKWINDKYAGIFGWDSSASKLQKAVVESTNKPNQKFMIDESIKLGDYNGGSNKTSMGLAVTTTSAYLREAAMLIDFLLSDLEGVEICSTKGGIPCSVAAVKILNDKNFGDGLVKETNVEVLAYSKSPLDTRFEHNDLKANPDGVYYKVLGKLSSDDYDGVVTAKALMDDINECLGS